jgi:hypothetical protein
MARLMLSLGDKVQVVNRERDSGQRYRAEVGGQEDSMGRQVSYGEGCPQPPLHCSLLEYPTLHHLTEAATQEDVAEPKGSRQDEGMVWDDENL